MSVVKGSVIPKVLFPSRYVISCHCCLQLYHCFTLLSAVISLFYIVVCSYITVLQLIFLCLFPYVFLSLRAYLFPCSATSRFRFIFPLLFLHLYTDFLFCFFFFISLPPVLRACDLFSARWTGRSAQVTNTTQHWYGAACSVVCTVWFSCRYRATYRLYSKCMLLQPFSE